MEVATRENGIIAGCVPLAIASFYAIELYTSVGAGIRTAIVLGSGIVLPTPLTSRYSS